MEGTRVLVVEDDPVIAAMLAKMLAAAGYTVETAHNGPVALDKLRGGTFALMLANMHMPTLDGFELYRTVEHHYPDISQRTIFITAYAQSPEIQAFLDKTGARMLSKPFTWAEMEQVLRQILPGN